MFILDEYKKYVRSKLIGSAMYLKVDITNELLEALFQFDKSPSVFLPHIPIPRIAEKYRLMFDLNNKNNNSFMNNWFLYTYGFKYCSKCSTVKSLIEFSSNKNVWDGKTAYCSLCVNAESYKWNAGNTEKRKQVVKQYAQTHKEVGAKAGNKYRLANLDKDAAKTAKRRAAKLQATPKWLTETDYLAILKFYNEAKRLEKETGIKYHVDHIVPLQGVNVCGLHVPWNLQVIPATDNIRKHNTWLS